MLSTEVRAITYHRDLDYYIPVKNLAFLPLTDVLDLRNSPLLLRSRGIMTCELALMEGDLTDLKKLCRYYIIKANIPPGVIKLTNNDFLLSNVTKATIICKEQNITHPIRSAAIQWVQNVHCGCVLKADEYVVTATSLHCPLDDNIALSFNPRYLSNLPYLTEFF